jgi:hypothetical protein
MARNSWEAFGIAYGVMTAVVAILAASLDRCIKRMSSSGLASVYPAWIGKSDRRRRLASFVVGLLWPVLVSAFTVGLMGRLCCEAGKICCLLCDCCCFCDDEWADEHIARRTARFRSRGGSIDVEAGAESAGRQPAADAVAGSPSVRRAAGAALERPPTYKSVAGEEVNPPARMPPPAYSPPTRI